MIVGGHMFYLAVIYASVLPLCCLVAPDHKGTPCMMLIMAFICVHYASSTISWLTFVTASHGLKALLHVLTLSVGSCNTRQPEGLL